MGLLRMATRTAVVAGTATAVSGRVAHKQQVKYNSQAEQQAAEAQQAAAQQQALVAQQAPAAPVVDEQTAKLQDLANLHSSGVLSDEEFTAAKAKVLGI